MEHSKTDIISMSINRMEEQYSYYMSFYFLNDPTFSKMDRWNKIWDTITSPDNDYDFVTYPPK